MDEGSPWRSLLGLAAPYRGRLVLVATLALLGTAAELAQPLVYRVAVNDVAGVFVERATRNAAGRAPPVGRRGEHVHHAPPGKASAAHHARHRHAEPASARSRRAPDAGTVFTTLLWAVGLLLVTTLTAQLFDVLADNSRRPANRIEEDFIRSTFRHVLQLRLGFFSPACERHDREPDRPIGHVAPIVTSFAKDILPEFRVVGRSSIMFTQSPKLTAGRAVDAARLFFVARRSARRPSRPPPAATTVSGRRCRPASATRSVR